ncbi:hypothetical protein TNCV_4328901 [Trichonephila clavipes]|nr:hypothetical protein TNCV_4328901 [Trichonephila clavipes]
MSKIKDDPQMMWKRRIIDMELNYHARPIQKNVGLSRRSPKSFNDWEMLIYVVKTRSFCRAWDRVIIGRDDSDRLIRNLRTATAGSDVVQSGRPIFDDFFQHLWPYIGNNTANVVFQMVKRL